MVHFLVGLDLLRAYISIVRYESTGEWIAENEGCGIGDSEFIMGAFWACMMLKDSHSGFPSLLLFINPDSKVAVLFILLSTN